MRFALMRMAPTRLAPRLRWVLLAAALTFIAVATLTPGSAQFTGALRPDFWCLACGATGGADVIVNVLLFVPFGVALALWGFGSAQALMTGALLSACIEFAQRAGFPPSRVFNATDLITNTAGAFAGALLVHSATRWLFPSQRGALRLASGAAIVLVALLCFTGWALGPVQYTSDNSPLRVSRLSFTPGYGWYHGFVSRVTLGDSGAGASITHQGDGPIILSVGSRSVRSVRVQLTGRDEREGFVPFVFLHTANDFEPYLLLGQQADDARLTMRLRGSLLRLPGPSTVLHGAFAEATGPREIDASVSARVWELAVTHRAQRRASQLRISLGIGWTLLQGVVSLDRSWAPLVTLAWLMCLGVPLGYWCALASLQRPASPGQDARTPGKVAPLVAGLLVLIAALAIVPQWAGIADCSWVEWCLAIAGYTLGVTFAKLIVRNPAWRHVTTTGHSRFQPSQ